MKRLEWVYHFLASKKVTLILFGILALFLIPRTVAKTEDITLGIPGTLIFGALSLNLLLCTIRGIRGLSFPVIVIHSGVLATFAGVIVSSFGYVATVNIYEGDSVDTVYRWDTEKDTPLGVDLRVKQIHLEYYPAPVKVGVLTGEVKTGLFELNTGESFQLDHYTVQVASLDFAAKNLKINVFNNDHFLGYAETEGPNNLPDDFPYTFRLVAFKNSPLKKMWVDLEISKDSNILAQGTSEVNSPLTFERLNFYNVKVDYDTYGNPYAGIQITYDPGLNYVFAGFIILGIGSLLSLQRRLYGKR